jgi:hypothetical protein
MTLTRVGSDHCPLLLDDGFGKDQIKRGFRFETGWLSRGEFREKLAEKWPIRRDEGVQDFWKRMKKELRQLSKGMGANLDGDIKRRIAKILRDIKWLDDKAKAKCFEENGWRLRYELERELEDINTYKQNILRKRCSEKWILLGDASTCFFHSVANGRRRKCNIHALETEGGEISETADLRKHIEAYYKQLFGREERGRLRLNRDFWDVEGSLSADEATTLIKPFTKKEIKDALDDMKSNTAPRPDGLPVELYKCF